MNGAGRRVTVADVAREAGVSAATVSYVLNNNPHQKIPESTRGRVHDAVAKLGYTRSAAARALSRGRTDTVLLALTGLPIGPHMANLIEALTLNLGESGLGLVAHQKQPHRTLFDLWRELDPAAVLIFAPVDPDEYRTMRAAGTYVCSIQPGPASLVDDAVVVLVPNERLGHMQATHLARAGHRRLGYAAPTDVRVKHLSDLRLSGVTAACRELGLPEPVVQPVPPEVDGAAGAAAAWHTTHPDVTAICAYNDEVAFALLAGMRTLGLTAPDDLAVIGVDNIPTAPYASPPLTTVDQDTDEMGAQLSRMLVDGIAGRPREAADTERIVRLVVRASA